MEVKKHPKEMSKDEIEKFLTSLAIKNKEFYDENQ